MGRISALIEKINQVFIKKWIWICKIWAMIFHINHEKKLPLICYLKIHNFSLDIAFLLVLKFDNSNIWLRDISLLDLNSLTVSERLKSLQSQIHPNLIKIEPTLALTLVYWVQKVMCGLLQVFLIRHIVHIPARWWGKEPVLIPRSNSIYSW